MEPDPITPIQGPQETETDSSTETPLENTTEKPSDLITPAEQDGPNTAAVNPNRTASEVDLYNTTVTLIKNKRGRFIPSSTSTPDNTTTTSSKNDNETKPSNENTRLLNDRLPAIGLLELANASDFAANIFNEIPVPVYAVVLMALGGAVALTLSVCAFCDAGRSWRNVKLLRRERRGLLREGVERGKEEGQGVQGLQGVRGVDVDVLLDVNLRDLGSELINRCGMDVLMGCGAVLVGVGSLMAIGGADEEVFFASNLLSGYIGNAPLALYGLASAAWSLYLTWRAGQHLALGRTALRDSSPVVLGVLRRRCRHVQVVSVLTAGVNLVGGAASLITATMWWGYAMLVPVIILSMVCNSWWRRKIGYDRPFAAPTQAVTDRATLVRKIEFAVAAGEAVRKDSVAPFEGLGVDSSSLPAVLEFMVANDLFEALCVALANAAPSYLELFGTRGDGDVDEITIQPAELVAAPKDLHPTLVEVARKCLAKTGPRHFQDRQQHLVEVLASSLRLVQQEGRLHDSLGPWLEASA